MQIRLLWGMEMQENKMDFLFSWHSLAFTMLYQEVTQNLVSASEAPPTDPLTSFVHFSSHGHRDHDSCDLHLRIRFQRFSDSNLLDVDLGKSN